MKTALKHHADGICRARDIRTLEDVGALVDPQAQPPNETAICEAIQGLPIVATAKPDSEWDNVLCGLVCTRFNASSTAKKTHSLVLRLSKLAPVSYIQWMLEEVVIGFAGLTYPITLGRPFH